MTDLQDLKRVARVTQDEHGQPVVQIPLEKWRNEPEDDMPDEWWDEFQAFLNENRVSF